MTGDILARIVEDCRNDVGHKHLVQSTRLHQLTEARRIVERLRDAAANGHDGDVHNALRAAAELADALEGLADAERRWAEVRDL